MKSSKRKTRSDKFPLTLHPTGQYRKKIKGKIRYFGTDKKRALENYLAQATFLHGTQSLMHKCMKKHRHIKHHHNISLHPGSPKFDSLCLTV